MGLKATAGHSFSVKNLNVDSDQSFLIDENYTTLDQLIYKYPFLPFAETTTAVNTLGMTRHFFELAEQILKDRKVKIGAQDYETAANEIIIQQKKILTLSESFYQSVQTSWSELLAKEKISKKAHRK
ncbi:hypothetical protein [Niabella ginsengisoli]|uniref:TolC family protein n=1 Tax=Niabella ginsengisoli TaxID=522298 RepID=A0ABS9SMF6_9BACT|nr:hypothetical protein [Niabella ginsengisoli]MCH5599544.1 hypothetical protein [Niabella ginsengisoli]